MKDAHACAAGCRTAMAAALLWTCGQAMAFAEKAPAVRWAEPASADLAWRGIVSLDGGAAGGGASMLYPAPNLAGLLAAILTHAALASSMQSAEQQRRQELADSVLAPYAPALRAWPPRALWQAVLSKASTVKAQAADAAAWTGEATPSFALAPDAGTLVLDVGAKLTPPGGVPVEVVVRVVSSPLAATDAQAHWTANDAQALKDSAAAMFGHALSLAAREAVTRSAQVAAGKAGSAESTVDPTPFRTHRYLMGNSLRSERAQKLGEGCARVVMRTLRGWLLSAPVPVPVPVLAAAAAPASSSAPTAALLNPSAGSSDLSALAASAPASSPASSATDPSSAAEPAQPACDPAYAL